MTEYPEAVVGAFMFNNKGEMLFVKSPKQFNKFTCPGGHIEFGESFEQALEREVKEETNLDVKDISFVNVHEGVFSEGLPEKRHLIFIDFICKSKPGNIILNYEATEHIWMKPEAALEKLDLGTYAIKTIKKILEMKK